MTTSPPPGMSDEQFKEYMKFVRSNQGSSGTGTPLDSSSLNDKFKATAVEAGKFAKSMGEAGSGVFETFQKLSSSGSSFSGDLIGMTKAAYNSRMELGQWSDLIKENGAKLSGLGGNVTRGTEAFAKLSKEFFDSGAANELRNIGYTSKDLNEILAIQASAQKSGYKDTEEGRRKSYMAAKELAEQMDAIAKLTGKSREEQMEEMKKKKVDGQVESKLRLLANGDMQKYAELQSEYQKLALEARKRGDEELFKQQFATGTYMTKAAGTQAAVLGQQSRAVEEAAARLAKGDLAGAREASSKADAAAMKNANDRTILTLGTMGDAGGAAASAATKFVETTDTMYHNVKRVADNNQMILDTQEAYGKALKMAYEDIRQTQVGRRQDVDPNTGRPTGAYRDVGQSGRAAAAVQSATQDVKSAAATVAAESISPETLKNLDETASKYYAAGLAKGLEDAGRKGLNNPGGTHNLGPDGKPLAGGPVSPSEVNENSGGAVGAAAAALRTLTDLTVNAVTGTANIFLDGKKIPGRSTGSIGTMGKMIEDFGQGTLAMLHGKESVMTQDQLMNLASGMKDVGVSGAVNTLIGAMPKGNPTGGMNGLDLSSISKDIKTSFSSVSGGGETTTQRKQSNESVNIQKQIDDITAQYHKDRDQIRQNVKANLPEGSQPKDFLKGMQASPEAKALEEKYKELTGPLFKKMEEGISWETTAKQDQLNEVRKLVNEQVSVQNLETTKKEEQLATTKKLSADEIASKSSAIIKTDAMRLAEIQKKRDTETTKPTGPGGEYTREEARIEAARLNTLSLEKLKIDSARALGGSQQTSTAGATLDNKTSVPKLPAMDLNAYNLPGIGPSIKSKAAGITPPKPDAATTQPDNKKPPEAGQPANAAAKPGSTTGKDASLNDVVASLNTLNKQMGQLLAQHEELGNKQVRATKNVGSGNLYKA
jgi:hypothetical protein